MPHLGITEVVLIHCIIVNNDYKQDSRVLYIFVPDKSFGQLLDISPKIFLVLKSFDSEFSYIEVRFTGQNSKSQEIEVSTIGVGNLGLPLPPDNSLDLDTPTLKTT